MKLLQTYQGSWAEHGIHPIFDSRGPLNWVRFSLVTLHQNHAPIMISSGGDELAVVILSGILTAEVANHRWAHLGGRLTVFEEPATTVYVPRDSNIQLESETERAEMAVCRTQVEQIFQPFVIGPQDVAVQQRGREQWHREVRNILGAGA
ncbi:MAG: 5-deoxy-glucuronate isomerase, partial [Firmicutes bacterium]|nr:5-deoxy-glucuronate isomerase [Bacillota bacterium]